MEDDEAQGRVEGAAVGTRAGGSPWYTIYFKMAEVVIFDVIA